MDRYQPLLFQPVPSLLRYSLSELVEEVRATHFPELQDLVEVRFAAELRLAYMAWDFMGRGRHLVVFHPALNHPDTPVEVLRFIAKHELLHIVTPPRMIGPAVATHPPEFWEREFLIGPERYAVWAWIRKNIARSRGRQEGYCVSAEWKRRRERPRTPYTPSLPFNGERWERICPEAGAQLQLPPDWAARPLPLA
jgi:hypothetical protein